ncbi:MAG: branched-chain amino acid ABC transporter permease [Archaeoglobus sp.]|uniref:branched-chain amino acid ABC transporter permease n=1 Tax=Archaeoglobus sp. TaxID=1872626 RepID=UPI001E190DA4|nr:branched-chain amino acid ABC transporter permease [Archaeoglobus sp.]MBO8179170.1 branched-chain amino acid ABC transporter permease [Archaeoglobus sp.]
MRNYTPLVTLLLIYAVMIAIGQGIQGMWQPIMLVIFYIAVGQALNIFLGMTGYVNFGYVALLGVGAYGMAVALGYYTDLGLIPALTLGFILAILLAFIVSMVVGGIALRLRGAYFAIATIGVNEGIKYLILGGKIWGGSSGIVLSGILRKAYGAETMRFLSTVFADAGLIVVAILSGIITMYILNSRLGYGLIALREDEDAAKVMGINVRRYKQIAFVISCILAGLIGATAWTLKLTYVFPQDVFAINYTVEAIVIVMLGGAGTLLGPVVGGLIYALLKYYLTIAFPGMQLLILAPLLIIVILLFPEGVVGYLAKAARGTRFEKFVR